ncbi:N-acetylmuramoyl-L-alanine amidase, partial [Klebsiella pneumoniae]|nr:N-acetylmuramoyl-L-alanine amidase [Klebsiella pneumoniae]
ARTGLATRRPVKGLIDPGWSDGAFALALERWGYDVADPQAATVAFQRRFRPELIDGIVDGESRAILMALLLARDGGAAMD